MVDVMSGVPEFVAVVEARGFRAAGRQLGVSGTALSKALRQLEARLGVTLLLRTTRRITLTHEGSAFLDDCQRVLADIQSGRFVKDFVLDNRAGQPELKASRKAAAAHPIEQVGASVAAIGHLNSSLDEDGYSKGVLAIREAIRNGDVYQAFNNLLSSEFYVPSGETTANNFERYRSDEAALEYAAHHFGLERIQPAEVEPASQTSSALAASLRC